MGGWGGRGGGYDRADLHISLYPFSHPLKALRFISIQKLFGKDVPHPPLLKNVMPVNTSGLYVGAEGQKFTRCA